MKRILVIFKKILTVLGKTLGGTLRRIFHPKYIDNEVKRISDQFHNLKCNSSANRVSFILTSDIHYDPLRPNNTHNIGRASNKIMKHCQINYHIDLGDISPQSCNMKLSSFPKSFDKGFRVFSPINKNQIIMTIGNHDGATGKGYMHQLTNNERANVFFQWQRENQNKKFGPEGTYYYIDDLNNRTRFIVLNSFWSDWEGADDGVLNNPEDSFFHNPRFGTTQLGWFAKQALSMPENYSAIICLHIPFQQTDSDVFSDIVRAFKEKTSLLKDGIATDFSNSSGEIIAIFHGHYHRDRIDMDSFAVPSIGITAAGNFDVLEKRIAGTASEVAMDVVSIDKTDRTISLIRFGAGSNRFLKY